MIAQAFPIGWNARLHSRNPYHDHPILQTMASTDRDRPLPKRLCIPDKLRRIGWARTGLMPSWHMLGWCLGLFLAASCGFPRPPHIGPDDAGDAGGAGDAGVAGDAADAPPGSVSCQLNAIGPPLANTDNTITLEGSFVAPVTVSFPGGTSGVATVLGLHRATVIVPAAATQGDLTVTTCGRTFGPLPFRRASFATGLGMFQSEFDQADGPRQSLSLVTGRSGHTSVVIGSSLYLLGGSDGSGDLNSVEQATVNADGSLRPFATVPGVNLMTARESHTTVVIGEYLYVIGGVRNGVALDSIERATIGPDGSLGPFTIVSDLALTTPRGGHASVVIGNYLYVLGGLGTASLSSIERAVINVDGSLGQFAVVAGLALLGARHGHTAAVAGRVLYIVGGSRGTSTLQDVEAATIDADGSLGPFAVVNGATLMTPRSGHTSEIIGGYLYVIGGALGNAALSSVERAPLAADGTLGAFGAASGTIIGTARYQYASATIGNYLYIFGGKGSSILNSVERTTLNASGSLSSFSSIVDGSVGAPVVIRNSAYLFGNATVRASIAADGTLGPFATVPGVALNTSRLSPSTAVIGSYIYVMGGLNFAGASTTTLNSIERAPVNSDGSLGPFSTLPGVLKTARYAHTSAAIGKYLYVFGGTPGGPSLSSVERATINADGSLGEFAIVAGVSLAAARDGHTTAVIGNFVYMVGGENAGALTSVERAAIAIDGSLGEFTIAPGVALVNARFGHTNTIVGRYLYVLGGEVIGGGGLEFFYDNLERAPVGSDGSLGQFENVVGNKLLIARAGHSVLSSSNYLYVLGGKTFGSQAAGSIERATLDLDTH